MKISRNAVLFILGALAGAYVLAILFVVAIAKLEDEKAISQTTKMARILIKQKEDWLKRSLVDYADWGAAYEHLHKTVDVHWAYDQDNLGPSLAQNISVEYASVFEHSGREVYSVADAKMLATPVLSKIRGTRELLGRAVTMPPRSVATGLLAIKGEPVLAAASIISRGGDTTVHADSQTSSVLMFGDRVSDGELTEIRDTLGLKRLRLVEVEPTSAQTQDVFMRTSDGSKGFLLDLAPPEPGKEMLMAVMPSILVVGVLFVLFLWCIGLQDRPKGNDSQEATAR